MTRLALSLTLLATWLVCLLLAIPAHAQNNRSFISGAGSDANTCTFTAPCRNAQRAHDMTNAGGEINVLDPAGYGALTINKTISIQGHGWGELVGSGGATAIKINAGPADRINLRGLVIEGFGTGATGVQFNTGATLDIQDCIVHKFVTAGVSFQPNQTTRSALSVSNSNFVHNGGAGMSLLPSSSGPVTAAIDRSSFDFNGNGGLVADSSLATGPTGTLNVAVTDSVASSNGNAGFAVLASSGFPVGSLALTRSTAVGNGIGIASVGSNAILRLTQSTVTGSTGLGYDANNGGIIFSYSDNLIDDNAGNIGTLTTGTKQ
jgi:hypothetical protein